MIRKRIISIVILLFAVVAGFSQEKITFSGTIYDQGSNETLIGACISFQGEKYVAYANQYGFFSITVPKGTYKILISNIGYNTQEEEITLDADTRKDFKISIQENNLDEVVVKTASTETTNLGKPEMSVNKLSVATIKKMPAILREVDIVKSLMMLPGVTNAGEASSGFNVRGGAVDQNLILLDEATIYTASHLFGFFSVFNPDAVKDLKLYKGGIPAQYGGRVASVLDIYQKNGNSKDFHVNGGVGLLTSKLLLEGPIVKDKGAFLVAGRSSYAHLFTQFIPGIENNSAYFFDLNSKLSYKLNENNNLYVSGYFGRDVFSMNTEFSNIYGNSTLNGRWNHLFSDKLFSNLSVIYSDYYYGLTLKYLAFDWSSGIKNFNIKYDFKHYISEKVKMDYGVNGIYYIFNPGLIKPYGDTSTINTLSIDKKYAFEPAAYVNFEHKLSNRISLGYGLRYSMFYRLGESTINIYENDNPVVFNEYVGIYESAKAIGTQYYGKNEVIQSYNNPEPRASIAYKINEQQSVKASYNRMVQYLQLVSNTSSPTPLDIWMPSDKYVKPQIADQVAAGYFRNLHEGKYSVEVESYYKTVKNRMDYIDGANLIGNEYIETVVLNGEMRAYGLEFMLKKNEGRLNGWISYTLSKAQQKTPPRTAGETGINYGEWYAANSDKTHNLAVTSAYTLNKKWTFGANFILQSGRPATYPNGQYMYFDKVIPSYGLRNEARLPAYHHLDISATLTPRKNEGRKWKGEWVFSIYNLYNRWNAASITFARDRDTGVNEATKISIFGIVPGVSYNFKF